MYLERAKGVPKNLVPSFEITLRKGVDKSIDADARRLDLERPKYIRTIKLSKGSSR